MQRVLSDTALEQRAASDGCHVVSVWVFVCTYIAKPGVVTAWLVISILFIFSNNSTNRKNVRETFSDFFFSKLSNL